MNETPTTFEEVAEQLAQRHFRPFPGHQHSKTPAMTGWNGLNKVPWDFKNLLLTIAEFQPAENYCACIAIQDELVCVDIDIVDEEAANFASKLADELFGVTPLVRIGLYPKQARIYRNDGDVRSRKLHPIETFSGSGQVVAFGWHAKANRPYLWLCASPLDIGANSSHIPLISQYQIDQFTKKIFNSSQFKHIDKQLGNTTKFRHYTTINDRLRMLTKLHGSWRHAAAIILSAATEGCRNETAWAVIASAAARGIPEEVLRHLFERYFTGWDGYSEAEFLSAIQRTMHSSNHTPLPFKI